MWSFQPLDLLILFSFAPICWAIACFSDSSLLSAVSDPRNSYGFAFSTGGSGVINLSAGDYVEVYAYISSGNTAGITTSRTWLSGFRIGA